MPGKNTRLLNGIPLISYSIRQALASELFSQVLVSSDDPTILDIASAEGASAVLRPSNLAGDFAPKIPAIIHAVRHAEETSLREFETVVDLDATSPLRNISDISAVVDLLESRGLSSVFTASEARRSPYFNQVMRHENGVWGVVLQPTIRVVRRQDTPKTFDMNASVYAWNRQRLIEDPRIFYDNTEMLEMPPDRSLDIDSELDFRLVSFLMDGNHNATGNHER